LLQNIGGIAFLDIGSIILAALQSFTQAENATWCGIKPSPSVSTRTNEILVGKLVVEIESQHAGNKSYQPGGTGLVTLNHLAHVHND